MCVADTPGSPEREAVGTRHVVIPGTFRLLLNPVSAEWTTPDSGEGPHVYLSTGCFHGDHAYCQAMTGMCGEKRPGQCKFCGAACVCPCHTENAEVPADTAPHGPVNV